MTPGQEVKRLRRLRGLTQKQLAAAAGVSESTVARIEADKTKDARGMTAVAAVLGAPEPGTTPPGSLEDVARGLSDTALIFELHRRIDQLRTELTAYQCGGQPGPVEPLDLTGLDDEVRWRHEDGPAADDDGDPDAEVEGNGQPG